MGARHLRACGSIARWVKQRFFKLLSLQPDGAQTHMLRGHCGGPHHRLDEASDEVEADLQRDFKKLAQEADRYCPIEAALAATAATTTFGCTNFTQTL
jgi:hypothetical protein